MARSIDKTQKSGKKAAGKSLMEKRTAKAEKRRSKIASTELSLNDVRGKQKK